MEALVRHLIDPMADHPDDIDIKVVEGDAAYILEVAPHEDDRAKFEADDERAMRHIRTILSAAAGKKKATIDLVADVEDSDEE